MATLALNVGYFIQGDVGSSAQNAHAQASGTPDQTGGAQSAAIQYFQSSGRGGGTFRYIRTFLNFDTSGITETSGPVKLEVPGTLHADTTVTAVKSTHATPILATGDDFNNIDVSTPYSSATNWSTGTNDIILNSTAITDIRNNDDFNVALLVTADAENTEEPLEEDGDISCGVNFGGTIQLVYALPLSSYIFLNSGKYSLISGKLRI